MQLEKEKRKLYLSMKKFHKERAIINTQLANVTNQYQVEALNLAIDKIKTKLMDLDDHFDRITLKADFIGLKRPPVDDFYPQATVERFESWVDTFLTLSYGSINEIKRAFMIDNEATISNAKVMQVCKKRFESRRISRYQNGKKGSFIFFLIDPNLNKYTNIELKRLLKL